MRLVSVERSDSPLLSGFLRITGTIRYDGGETQTIWFDVPADQEASINDQGDAWAALLLPEASVRGEDLVMDLPVDPTLLDNLRGLNRLWQSWYKYVHPVEVRAPAQRASVAGTETALFFSGGVDSFFSLIRSYSLTEHPGVPATSCLLTVWGSDVPISKPEEFNVVRTLAEDTARQFNMDSISIATNATGLSSAKRHFGQLTHGSSILAAGMLLSARFQNLIFASSADMGRLRPWGSHPLSDPLFSTSQTRVIHDGAANSRVEKTEVVGSNPAMLAKLRVCWALGEASNCSRCSKCIRTMTTLDMLGLTEHASNFDWTDYSTASIAKTFVPYPSIAIYTREVRDAARARGRDDLARATAKCLRRSFVLRYSIVGLARYVWTKMKRSPSVTRVATPFYRVLKRRLIRG